jgi:hypothetical protein
MNHAGGLGAQVVVAGHPLVVVEGAVEFRVSGQPAHGLGGGPAQGADGGMVHVHQVGRDGEIGTGGRGKCNISGGGLEVVGETHRYFYA